MRKRSLYFFLFIFISRTALTQDMPNVASSGELSPGTAAAARDGSSQVNLFTGCPNVSVPLFSYDGKGMSFSISANYLGGGTKDGEYGSAIGIDWYLSAGGAITRTVRGEPDDVPTYGYMNAAAIPTDFRSNADKYYYDSLDAQPDVFTFNFNGRSGKFYIGKSHQIVIIPQSNLKIQYTTDATSHLIIAFKITAENGVKYLFNNAESTTQTISSGSSYFRSKFPGTQYNSAWYLSQVISPFNTDTIKLSYITKTLTTDFSYPSVSFVKVSDHTQTELYTATGVNTSTICKISQIAFPNKVQVSFVYSGTYGFKYDDTDNAIVQMKISDSIFRKGFWFDYQTSYTGPTYKPIVTLDDDNARYDTVTDSYATNLLLKSITPYTNSQFDKGYNFIYNTPFPSYKTYYARDSVLNAFDYWGFFNGAGYNLNPLPYIANVNNSGAWRFPSINAKENSLEYVVYPTGGVTHYEYELNTILTDSTDGHQITVNNSTASSSNNINLTQTYAPVHQFTFSLPDLISRAGSPPLSGTCNLVCNVKSTDGVTLYATTTISLYDLFYEGIKVWTINLANGTYKLETSLSGGGTITSSLPFTISWNNQSLSARDGIAGGIRVSRITQQASLTDTSNTILQEFKYITTTGRSSGFLGKIPQYYYPFTETITSPSLTTNLYAVSSDPINSLNYAEGSPVGYSRIEVYKGTVSKNLGKTVYEFTDLANVGTNYFLDQFPYAPQDIKDWGLGLPKVISIYDSSDNLVEKKTNQYTFNSTAYNTSDFKGLKLGSLAIAYAQDPDLYPTTTRTNTYFGEEYYPSTGWAAVTNTTDTTYHDDGSIQTSQISYTYDSNLQVSKITSPYDRTRSLNLETRIYYPYSYTFSSGSIKTLKDSSIITPVISTEKWITGDANPRIVAGSITSFQTLGNNQIVPAASYKFQSNQPISQSTIGTFDPSQLVRNSTYFKQQASYSRFDGSGNDIQVTNSITGQTSSILYDYNFQLVIAKISNAAIDDVAYTSFESDGKGYWTTIGSDLRDQTSSITGKQSYNLSNGTITKTGLNTSLTYFVTFWAKSGASVTINGASAGTALSTHNTWSLYSVTVTGVSSVTVSGSGLIDELRLFPKDANMVTYTYEPNVGVTSTCDANNTIVYTNYDSLYRPKLIRDIDKNIIKRYDYSDSTFPVLSSTANWVAIGKICEGGNDAKFDSVYSDENPYSNSYQDTMHVMKGYDYCGCANSCSSYFKIINGTCEEGTRDNLSTVNNHNGTWTCAYQIEWSSGPPSSVVYEIDSSACTLGPAGKCLIGIP